MTGHGKLAQVVALGLLLGGCHGLIGGEHALTGDGGLPAPPVQPAAPDPCLSDPDRPGSVVCDAGNQWACVAQGASVTCSKDAYDLPGGTPTDWSCNDRGEFTQCTSTTGDAPTGNPGWTCTRDDASGKIVCLSGGNDEPGRGGPWDCVYDDVAGATCTSTDSGDWTCWDEGTRKLCYKDHADQPNDQPGWSCAPLGGGVRCHHRTPGESADQPGWTCVTDATGTTCTTGTPDEPGFGGPWTCVYDDVGGLTCSSDASGGWDCAPDGNGNTTCAQDNPETPDSGSWDCYDAEGKTICIGTTGDEGGNGQWTCWTDDVGRERCEQTPDYPPDEPGNGTWNCWYDDVGNRVCSDAPPDTGDGDCAPGVKRWCDGATYCSWGQQTCLPNGQWGPCYEDPGIRPNTLCACYFFYYNTDCCETPDCIVPAGTTGQTCPAPTGKLCDYCNGNGQCDNGGLCIFTNTGESFCGQDCTSTGCPDPYQCRSVTDQAGNQHRQCVPADLSCYY